MRLAALYDIHGNLAALDTVLAETDALHVDLVVVGGDIVWGPMPAAVLERLQDLGSRAAFIQGNADREVADRVTDDAEEWVAAITRWCSDQLTDEERGFLRRLPEAFVTTTALGPTLFCHGSPRSDEEKITPATRTDDIEAMLYGVSENLVVCGHTHMQFDRTIGATRVVNAGSVGLPYEGTPGAFWALIDEDIELRRTDYDIDEAAAAIRDSGCPDSDGLAEHVLQPPTPEHVMEQWGT